ncbi:MAG: GNAT family N-acetyltransferase [Eubacteriales bacterium]|nr:GNAT family N-acetyltransferase [Eubacteriales bacterium]
MKLKILETKDLLLRPFRMSDLNDFYEYAQREEIGPKAGWKPHPNKEFSAKILQSFIKNNEVYAIVLKEENKVIGSIGIHERMLPEMLAVYSQKSFREIGYVLHSAYWNRGFMSQAVAAIIYYAFHDLKLDFLVVAHSKDNPASGRVIEKCGFRYVGSMEKEMVFLDGEIRTSCYYILEYDKSYKAISDGKYDEIPIF